MPSPNQIRLFISHHEVDTPWVTALASVLEQVGCRCFHEGCLVPGDPILGTKENEIAQADHVLVIVSPEAMARASVGHERGAFSAHRAAPEARIVPIVLRKASMPPFMKDLVQVRVEASPGARADGLRRLVAALRGADVRDVLLPDGAALPPPPPAPLRGDGQEPAAGPAEPPARPPDVATLLAYLAALEKDIRHQPLALDHDGASLHLLEEVYVELCAADRRGPAGAGRMPIDGGPQPIERFLELSTPRCWSVLGEPGSGKSTLLKHLALVRAERARRDLEAGRDPGPAAIPVLVGLAELHASGGVAEATRRHPRAPAAVCLRRSFHQARAPSARLSAVHGRSGALRRRRGDTPGMADRDRRMACLRAPA